MVDNTEASWEVGQALKNIDRVHEKPDEIVTLVERAVADLPASRRTSDIKELAEDIEDIAYSNDPSKKRLRRKLKLLAVHVMNS